MSHVVKIDLQVKDLEALKAACESMGLELVQGQTSYKWYGRSVGDTPLPQGFTVQDLGKCSHAIRIPGNSQAYEIGVCRNKSGDGYSLLWDSWAGGYGMVSRVSDGHGENVNKLKQAYGTQVTLNTLRRQGYRIAQSIDAQGNVVLRGSK